MRRLGKSTPLMQADPALVETLRNTLRLTGRGKSPKDLKKIAPEPSIMAALLWMLERGMVARNGKRWLLAEAGAITILVDGEVVEPAPIPQPPPRIYPVLREGLAANGFEHYRGRIIRKTKYQPKGG